MARVYVVPFAQDTASHPELLEGLRAAAGFLRGEVGRQVGLRHAPRLDFEFDDSFDKRGAHGNAAGADPSERQPDRSMTHGILLLDKPQGLSSNAALQHVRRALGGVKAGHTGSLDPLATGMLPLCLGEATKVAGYLLEGDKQYRFTDAAGPAYDHWRPGGRGGRGSACPRRRRGRAACGPAAVHRDASSRSPRCIRR